MKTTIKLYDQLDETTYQYIYQESCRVRTDKNCTSIKYWCGVTVLHFPGCTPFVKEVYNMISGIPIRLVKKAKIEAAVLAFHRSEHEAFNKISRQIEVLAFHANKDGDKATLRIEAMIGGKVKRAVVEVADTTINMCSPVEKIRTAYKYMIEEPVQIIEAESDPISRIQRLYPDAWQIRIKEVYEYGTGWRPVHGLENRPLSSFNLKRFEKAGYSAVHLTFKDRQGHTINPDYKIAELI